MSTALSLKWQTFRYALHNLPFQKATKTACPIKTSPLTIRRQVGDLKTLCYTTRCCSHSSWRNCHTPWRDFIGRGLEKQLRSISLWRESSGRETTGQNDDQQKEIVITSAQVEKIFGRYTDPEKAIQILTDLQNHRVQGTLDQKLPHNATLVAKGLMWLRNIDPLDEDAAIVARIDRELNGSPQLNAGRSPQGESQFEKLQQFNKERNKLEEEKKGAEEKAIEQQKGDQTPTQTNIQAKGQTAPSNNLVALRPEPEWVRKHREKATNQDISKTRLSTTARLLPSAAVVIGVVALSLLFAQNYTPPSKNARIWPELPPAAATVFTIIGLNVVVFLLWKIPPLWTFMNRNFLIAPVYPHAMSMLGAPFSHQKLIHLFSNCCFIWLVGSRGKL